MPPNSDGSIRGAATLMLPVLEPAGGPLVLTIITTKRALQIMGLAALAASAGVVGAQSTPTAQSDTVTIDVSECVNLPSPEARLACFEAQVETARTAPPAAAAPAAAAPSSSSGQGLGQEIPDPPDIHAAVAELKETVPNSWLITLDNGQVWRQTVPERYALRVGSPVRIYFSRWRAYRLTNEQLRGYIQVERVR
jgi:hypothetical protein